MGSQSRQVEIDFEQKDKALTAAHDELAEAKINQTGMLSRISTLVNRLDEKDAALATAESSLSSAEKEYEEMQTKQSSAWKKEKHHLVSLLRESEASLQNMTSKSRKVEIDCEE